MGTYVTMASPQVVDVAALAGLDFVRIDGYHGAVGLESMDSLVRAAAASGLTPWVRCDNDPTTIMNVLDLGAEAVTVPNVDSAEAARAAVRAAYYPPRGSREMNRPLRSRNLPPAEYFDWVDTNVLVAIQIEGLAGLESCEEIVRVDGVGCVQSGRGDLALALGVPGEDQHPSVLRAEERIVSAALEAGKEVSVLCGFDEDGIERAQTWIDKGVRIITLGSDWRALWHAYGAGIRTLRAKVK